MAAFVISKGKFRGLNFIFWMVQFSLLYTAYTLEVPRYLIYSKLGMIDSYWIYILPYLPSTMGVFLIKQYMDGSVPDALIEAAHIDGANDLQIFWRIIMPISKPAWLTLCLFAFRDLWSMQPTGTIFSEELKMIPNVMSTIINGGIARSGSAMAATVLLMIPPIIVYMVSQSNVMETMSSAGIK
jgi:ABC-type glycerol-3-phosphate transport system permease component